MRLLYFLVHIWCPYYSGIGVITQAFHFVHVCLNDEWYSEEYVFTSRFSYWIPEVYLDINNVHFLKFAPPPFFMLSNDDVTAFFWWTRFMFEYYSVFHGVCFVTGRWHPFTSNNFYSVFPWLCMMNTVWL